MRSVGQSSGAPGACLVTRLWTSLWPTQPLCPCPQVPCTAPRALLLAYLQWIRFTFGWYLEFPPSAPQEKSLFKSIPWAAGVFDEAHKLKGLTSSTRGERSRSAQALTAYGLRRL